MARADNEQADVLGGPDRATIETDVIGGPDKGTEETDVMRAPGEAKVIDLRAPRHPSRG